MGRHARGSLRWWTSALVGAALLAPGVASAQDQPWLQDRRYSEGVGIKAGDFELHPGGTAEFGYDSNYLHRDDGSNKDESPISSLRLRITPSFMVETLDRRAADPDGKATPPPFTFSAELSATYNEFFPLSGGIPVGGDGGATDRSNFRDQRNVGVEADLKAVIAPKRPFSVALNFDYTRLISPSTSESIPTAGSTIETFNRDVIIAGGDLIWTPGAGLFDWHLGYQFTGQFFEAGDLTGLDNVQHQIETKGRWRFLPRTAFLFDTKLGFISYPSAADTASVFPQKTSSHPLRTELGLNGQVTDWMKVLVMGGWGASFYTPKGAPGEEDFDSFIGQAEVQFYIAGNPSETAAGGGSLTVSSVAVGFQRDFFDSYIGSYYEQDRAYATLNYFYRGQFFLQVMGGVGPLVYPSIDGTVALTPASHDGGWTDVLINTSLYGEYRIKDVFGIGATIRYDQMISSTQVPTTTTGAGTGPLDSLAWKDFQAYLTLRYVL
jgi:hypothetical protein